MLVAEKSEFCEIFDQGDDDEEDIDEEDEVFTNPIEHLFYNRIFANPTKKHAKRAPKIKRMQKLTNQDMGDLFSVSNLKKYENDKETCEFFGQPLWAYKEYLGKKFVGEVLPGQKKNGGAYIKKYASFLGRSRDIKKTLNICDMATAIF